MHIDPLLSQVQDQLAATAALGDDRTREVATALATAAGPAIRLAVLTAVSAAADEATEALLDHPGSPVVSARQDGDEIRVAVTGTAPVGDDTPAEPRREDGDASARISLRLSESLKSEIDVAAEQAGISVNTWLVRAAAAVLDRSGRGFAGRGPVDHGSPARGGDRRRGHDSHRITGWINS